MGTEKYKRRVLAAEELRMAAEKLLRMNLPDKHAPHSEQDARRLVHELAVHQVELEMQNGELHQAREELETLLEQYTDLYDFAPVGYCSLARDGTIRAANLSAASLLGVERAHLLRRNFLGSIAEQSRAIFNDLLGRVFETKGKQSCELILVTASGESCYVQIDALVSASGEECRIAIIDITQRRQMGEKLEILHAKLAEHSAQLEKANVELEAFNYTVSHDLRIPLTTIHGYSQVLLNLCAKQFDEQCLGFLQQIHDATLRMNRLISSLLRLSRFSHAVLRHERVDLSRMAEEVAMQLQATTADLPVAFRIAPGVVVSGDEDLLRAALDNLLGNAWKYTSGQAEAVIEFGVTEFEGTPACFVRDNGTGFDMAHAEEIFLPFQRLTPTSAAGHGIGLATVDRIVRRHGGRVWAESAPGQGATFYFTIPSESAVPGAAV